MNGEVDAARAWMAGSGLAFEALCFDVTDPRDLRNRAVGAIEHLQGAERSLALLDAIVNLHAIARAYHVAARRRDSAEAFRIHDHLERVFFERITEIFEGDA